MDRPSASERPGASQRIQGSAKGSQSQPTQKQQTELLEYVFTQTVELMWVQAQALFGEDASQVICDAVKTEDPANHIRDYLPNALSTAS